jgi:hypothetical protein
MQSFLSRINFPVNEKVLDVLFKRLDPQGNKYIVRSTFKAAFSAQIDSELKIIILNIIDGLARSQSRFLDVV